MPRSAFPYRLAPWPHGAACTLLAFLLFALPLAVVPAATDSFLLSKAVLLLIGAVFLVVLAAGSALSGRDFRIPLSPMNGLALAWWAWTGLSALWSEAPALAWDRFWMTTGLFAVFAAAQSLMVRDRGLLVLAAKALAWSSLAVALWVLAVDFKSAFGSAPLVRITLGDWRDYIGTAALGNTSHIADFLALGFLAWAGFLAVARGRFAGPISVAALVLHAAALIVCWSVHSNLSVIVGSGLLVFLAWKTGRMDVLLAHRKRVAAAVCGWVLVVAFFAVDHPANPHGSAVWLAKATAEAQQYGTPAPAPGGIFAQAFSSPRWKAGWPTRLAIWYTGLEIVRHNPWLGHGAGNFTWQYPATISPIVQKDPELAPYAGAWTNAAHNDLIQTWADLGIVGIFLLLAAIGTAFKTLWDRIQGTSRGNFAVMAVSAAMLAAVCVQMQMNFPLQLPVSSLVFLMLLAVPTVLPPKGREEQPLLVPVERGFGAFRLGIYMRNMAYPSEVYARLEAGGTPAAAVLLAVALVAAWPLSAPLRADIAYRDVYESRRRGGDPKSLIAASEKVLAIWPGHIDCRSGLQGMLLEAGEFQRVVDETPRVLERLNAIEVYGRRADALARLGQPDDADRAVIRKRQAR